ncbi:GDSL-like lipolytic enzyme [Ectocarpus siliculosus]|uniref:GDSL-like lipolytic enzyme n=1 Tax=Ectocarpus siliculosus TaxID=2880 RepID=D8LHV8_ECTSI|nr:GDSL-like lipolytic enzyme [Ectocarpus siliculosus]|eukprot:CBN74389.1 GDSL-like lipolytic enzyme [Ectocarpus siliculosus]
MVASWTKMFLVSGLVAWSAISSAWGAIDVSLSEGVGEQGTAEGANIGEPSNRRRAEEVRAHGNRNGCKKDYPCGTGSEETKIIVFGDSNSDAGRRFDAPNVYPFSDIGVYPWEKVYDADGEGMVDVYHEGTNTNGKVWAQYLNIPNVQNYATGSGTATDTFRSQQLCTGYTTKADKASRRTGTLGEQMTKYLKDFSLEDGKIGCSSEYTHFIGIGMNDVSNVAEAMQRTALAEYLGVTYTEPVSVDDMNFVTMMQGVTDDIVAAVATLIEMGVTGRILVPNFPSPFGVPAFDSPDVYYGLTLAEFYDQFITTMNTMLDLKLSALSSAGEDQVRVLDLYSLIDSSVHDRDIFNEEGFKTSSTPEQCLTYNFHVDSSTDIMGSQAQALRGKLFDWAQCDNYGPTDECVLCQDQMSPCQNCLVDPPTVSVCDSPDEHIFWDGLHTTDAFNKVFANAVFECSKDELDGSQPWVGKLCPAVATECSEKEC